MFGTAASGVSINPNKDVELVSPPDDGVSSLCWSSKGNFLVGTSWNSSAYCWEVNAQGGSQPKTSTKLEQPVLCSAWHHDGDKVFLAGCDKKASLWQLGSNSVQQVGAHDAPIRHVAWIPRMNLLATGSWDRTLKYWDLRSPTPVHTQQLSERVYAMDCRDPLLVVGTADRQIHVINLNTPQQIFKSVQSPLKYQTRSVCCFPDTSGYLVGSIEGRVAVHHVEDSVAAQKNFTFKCHRENNDIYSVNSMAFHPEFGTFVTAGSDGTFNFWDKDSKQRLKAMSKCAYTADMPAPITAGAFNSSGSIYAYALSYDWSRGYAHYNPATMKTYIMLHAVTEAEVKARPKAATAGRK